VDYAWAKAQGARLAQAVSQLHAEHPEVHISLLGHSAGAAVALLAAEAAEPGAIDSVVVLAPSVSADFDVRPALSHINCTLDVFHSIRDWLYVGVTTRVVGTVDRTHRVAAGRVGFRILSDDPCDALLYTRLRQHAWQPADRELGNNGGHYGGYQPDFLRAQVIPIFFGK
jgi:hypothetical protein